jgi:DNA-binding PadR family transcriptional regulator
MLFVIIDSRRIHRYPYHTHSMNNRKMSMSPRRQSPPTVEYALLGLLLQQPMHGYELHKAMEHVEGLSMVWTVKQSQLYALLDRLEADGLVQGRRVAEENRPARLEYSLTPQGRSVLNAWLAVPADHGREIRLEFMAKLYFAERKSPETARRLLEAQCLACQQWKQTFEQQAEALSDSHSFERVVVDFRIKQVDGIISWLASCQARYAE